VFYESLEELRRHEDSHKLKRAKGKHHSFGAGHSRDDDINSYHTEEQQEWIKKILSDTSGRDPDKTKKADGNDNEPYAIKGNGNTYANVSPSVNMSGLKIYFCKACQLAFESDEERQLHRLFHHKLKLPCRFCPRTLDTKRKLLGHESSHFKKPKLDCKRCGQVFEDSEALKRHRRACCVIQELPRFSCQICKRLYVRENELKIHLETHLDERPFLCEKCGQCFKDVPSLRAHRSSPCKAKGSTRDYNCDICVKSFRNARLLVSHRLHHHKGKCQAIISRTYFAHLLYLSFSLYS
jgi:hypothetical protein